MEDHVYRLTEIVGTSSQSSDDAIKAALERARQTLRNLRWFEVKSVRGSFAESGTIQYQVLLRVGFTLDE